MSDVRLVPASEPKRDAFLRLIAGGEMMVHLDATRDGVVVPGSFAGRQDLALAFGRDLATPIPDLEVDAQGIRATLSFDRRPFHCTLPWEAIYAMTAGEGGVVWEDSVPVPRLPPGEPAVRREAPRGRHEKPLIHAATDKDLPAPATQRPIKRGPPRLHLVK
jgi:hypothetical protein